MLEELGRQQQLLTQQPQQCVGRSQLDQSLDGQLELRHARDERRTTGRAAARRRTGYCRRRHALLGLRSRRTVQPQRGQMHGRLLHKGFAGAARAAAEPEARQQRLRVSTRCPS